MQHKKAEEQSGGDGGPARDARTTGADRPHRKPHILEWAVGGLSSALVIAMVGFVIYDAVSGSSGPPDITVTAEQVKAAGGGFRVEFRAVNRGDTTAAHLEIEGQLKRGEETIGTSEVTLDYLPPHSERRGGLFFEQDPRQYQLHLQAKGYSEP